MSSKLTAWSRAASFAVGLTLSATLILGACARVGEDPPPPDEHGLEGTRCLSEASRVMSEFVRGEAQTDEVGGAWNCFGGAFEAFHQYVRGDARESYTPQELATYLENNFIEPRGRQIPVGLQTEFMKIKQIFVGGSRDRVTRDEILAVVQLTRALGKVAEQVNPYMKVYLIKWETRDDRFVRDQKYFEDANAAIQTAAAQLSALVQKKHDPYRLDDVTAFVEQLETFLQAKWPATDALRQFMPVARKVKRALAGGDEAQIVPAEWRRILLLGSRAYIQYLRYHYFIEKALTTPPAGQSRPFPMDYVARAFEDTFSIFEDLVREKPSGVVSRAELIDICDALSKAWPVFKYSDDLVSEVMKLKQTLVGGTLDALAATDFQTARLKVSTMKTVIGRVLPFLDIYLGDWSVDSVNDVAGVSRFNHARSAMDQSLKELGAALESNYDIRSVTKLISEFEKLYPPPPGEAVSKDVEKYLPFVVQIKNLLFNEDDSVIKKEQWPAFLGYASDVFGTYRFYGYFLAGKSDLKRETYEAMSRTTDQAIGLLSTLMKVRGRALITTAEVEQVLLQLRDIELIPSDIEPETIDAVLKIVLNRILNPPALRLAGQRPNGIRPTTLAYIQAELQGWIQTQAFLLDVMAQTKNGRTITPSALRRIIAGKIADPKTTPELKDALGGLIVATGGDLPFVLDQGGRLLISRRLGPDFNLPSLWRHNLVREVTRIFLASYAGNLSRIRKSVTAAEAERAFRELGPVAVDYGLLDPNDTGFMTSRFREANLFMPRSDGDQIATFAEVHELIFAIASGLNLNSSLRPGLLRDCPPVISRRRSLIVERVDYGCLYENYKKGFRKVLTSMPEFLRFQKGSSEEAFGLFFFNSLKGAGYVPNGTRVKTSDVALLPQLIQYEELLFARFDTNSDGVIDVQEARRAFPAFREIFKVLAKKELESGNLKNEDLIAVFTWVLKYGKPPETIWEKLQFLSWAKNPDRWDSEADRSKIASILGYIADQLAKQ